MAWGTDNVYIRSIGVPAITPDAGNDINNDTFDISQEEIDTSIVEEDANDTGEDSTSITNDVVTYDQTCYPNDIHKETTDTLTSCNITPTNDDGSKPCATVESGCGCATLGDDISLPNWLFFGVLLLSFCWLIIEGDCFRRRK